MRIERRRLYEIAFTMVLLGGSLTRFSRFVSGVETRPGVLLPDPVLARIPVHDVTWLTFGAIYASLGYALFALRRSPDRLLAGAQAYAVMVLLRMTAMALLPLDPPPDAIPLDDPVVRFFGPSQLLTRDLFFSGHTATCTLLALAAPRRAQHLVLAVAALVVAACVLTQHVHYTIDVLAAPAFTTLAWRVTLSLRRLVRAPDVEAPDRA